MGSLFVALLALAASLTQAKEPLEGFEKSANIATDDDIILPQEAAQALVNTPWLQKFYHDPKEVRIQSRFLPEGLLLRAGDKPVVVDDRLRAPGEDFARLEIRVVEEVKLLRGYAVGFKYPSEGVFGNVLLVPGGDGWRVITVEGGER